ncbi:LuxR family transcriptional regulator [Pseudohalocynthiibacter aestuariivivens]|uniref:LuxR family transcriptional regulator n=1 Tax=Roseovarius pelagicus TaxID=2980108 RepID=A0ABY6DBX5_9RHOB|nr:MULTISPECIES: LuxR family transcriptional regulator [Rhodobacterales]QIE44447.1 LuxR family transcriptional regulator [Pseudohalocynthiibacter aestuariivivens]UXX83636.1 LuxR family transcriptional regulator [Roseovarius pelagicus]
MISPPELQQFLSVSTIEELWGLLSARLEQAGFDRLLYGATRYRSGASLGDPEDFILLSTHDTAYTDKFVGGALYFHAPMVKWALENDGASSWSVLRGRAQDGLMTDAERKVMAFNAEHGVTAGYSISFRSASPRIKGAMALTARAGLDQSDADRNWDAHGADIQALCTIAHLRFLLLPYIAPGRVLTSRQREVLSWVGDGKTIQDIALLLELTPATIEKHLRLARDALCVETTAQAVLKASFQHQIYISAA